MPPRRPGSHSPPYHLENAELDLSGNPARYDVVADLRSGAPIDSWSVTRHLDDFKAGDNAALWLSGPRAGVYALGTVVGEPFEGIADEGWHDPEDRGVRRWFPPLDLEVTLSDEPRPGRT